jgi:hypothetical protein
MYLESEEFLLVRSQTLKWALQEKEIQDFLFVTGLL